jgi:hypothetical protein
MGKIIRPLLFVIKHILPRSLVAMRFAPVSAGFVFSSGVGVNAKWRRVILY